jgi:hypothetical protein
MQKIVLIWLIVCGILPIVGAISGIASVSCTQDKIVVIHYSGVILKIINVAIGCGLLFVAWLIRKKLMLGWKLFF